MNTPYERRAKIQAEIELAAQQRARAEDAARKALYERSAPMSPREHHRERERVRALDAQRRAEDDARRLKSRLWARYRSAAPGATEEQFERVFPSLLEQHRQDVALGKHSTSDDDAPYADPALWGLG